MDENFSDLYERRADMVYRLCYMYLRNSCDAEDAAQAVFLKLLCKSKHFFDDAHEKAWLIAAARNHCKDVLKSGWRSRRASLDDLPEIPTWDDPAEGGAVLQALLVLPETYKTALYLYYFEGYSVREMAQILGRRESTLQTQLARGRAKLKLDLGGEYHEESRQ